MNVYKINIEDIQIGDVVEFYDQGFRFDFVTKISKSRINKKTNLKEYIIHTQKYGKQLFTKIKAVYMYKNHKTIKKTIISDLFV